MSILKNIKQGVASSGSNKGKMVYLKPDSKTRIRFLQEIEDGLELRMHDSFDQGINSVCQKHFKKKCALCKDDSMRTRQGYIWSVWDYDAKEVKLFLGYANNFSPLPNLIAMYESYETIMDRDYILTRDGTGTNSRYGVVPMDKVKFKNSKAKPYPKPKMLEILNKAFPYTDPEGTEDDDMDEDDVDTTVEEDEVEENEYEEMSAKELYMECIERDIKAKKKKDKDYYIDLLIADDLENEDSEDDEDEDW